VISVPRTVADNLDQSDDSSGPSPIDYSEKRSLPITIPDYHTVQHASERFVVRICFVDNITSITYLPLLSEVFLLKHFVLQHCWFGDRQDTRPSVYHRC